MKTKQKVLIATSVIFILFIGSCVKIRSFWAPHHDQIKILKEIGESLKKIAKIQKDNKVTFTKFKKTSFLKGVLRSYKRMKVRAKELEKAIELIGYLNPHLLRIRDAMLALEKTKFSYNSVVNRQLQAAKYEYSRLVQSTWYITAVQIAKGEVKLRRVTKKTGGFFGLMKKARLVISGNAIQRVLFSIGNIQQKAKALVVFDTRIKEIEQSLGRMHNPRLKTLTNNELVNIFLREVVNIFDEYVRNITPERFQPDIMLNLVKLKHYWLIRLFYFSSAELRLLRWIRGKYFMSNVSTSKALDVLYSERWLKKIKIKPYDIQFASSLLKKYHRPLDKFSRLISVPGCEDLKKLMRNAHVDYGFFLNYNNWHNLSCEKDRFEQFIEKKEAWKKKFLITSIYWVVLSFAHGRKRWVNMKSASSSVYESSAYSHCHNGKCKYESNYLPFAYQFPFPKPFKSLSVYKKHYHRYMHERFPSFSKRLYKKSKGFKASTLSFGEKADDVTLLQLKIFEDNVDVKRLINGSWNVNTLSKLQRLFLASLKCSSFKKEALSCTLSYSFRASKKDGSYDYFTRDQSFTEASIKKKYWLYYLWYGLTH